MALLKYGINNTIRSEDVGSTAATAYKQICSSYNSYKAHTLHADASGNYYMISGQGSVTQSELEAIGQAMCDTEYTDQKANKDVSNFSSIVSPTGLAAFQDCIHATENGLTVTIDFDEEAPEIVRISEHYVPVGSHGTNHVHPIVIVSSAPTNDPPVTCEGPLSDVGKDNGVLDATDLVMTCRRPVVNDPEKTFPIAGKLRGIAFPASITVPTDVGPIKFLYGARFLPPPSSPIIPAFAGEIRALAFQSSDGDYAKLERNGWLECDGRALKVNDYPDLYKAIGTTWGSSDFGTTFKLPNLQGQFLRGWSHGTPADPEAAGRTVADPTNPNPAWSGAIGDHVGSQQGDAFQTHTHAITNFRYDEGSKIDPHNGHVGALFNYEGSTATTPPVDGKVSTKETRPKNVSVMYVIYTGKAPQL